MRARVAVAAVAAVAFYAAGRARALRLTKGSLQPEAVAARGAVPTKFAGLCSQPYVVSQSNVCHSVQSAAMLESHSFNAHRAALALAVRVAAAPGSAVATQAVVRVEAAAAVPAARD